MPLRKSAFSHGICTYCGKTGSVTRDHVPPKSLFPKPRPSSLVSVPSCRACNVGASKDDEYFRLNLSIRETDVRPVAKAIADDAIRGLARGRSTAFRTTFLRGVREVDLVSKAGIYLGRGGTYNVNLKRLNSVAKRIVRGLYLHHYKKLLPFGDSVEV